VIRREKSNAIIYTIDIFDEINHDRNPRLLKKLAKVTGGEDFLPESMTDLVSICRRIAYDIRNQYSIACLPANMKQDGKHRIIKVTARTKDGRRLSVRTRTGYYASLEPQPLPAKESSYEISN
jgi:VWFA-related protein